jgi:hypothetical protein
VALQEQAISIPILPMNQKSSEVSGPVGRIKRLVNGVVDKFDANSSWLRIVKRPAFRVLPRTTGNPYDGGHSGSAGVPTPSVIDVLGKQLFAVGSDATPYVYSAASQAWQKFSNDTVITNAVSTTPIWTQSTQSQCPDSATAGLTHCFVWSQGGQCWALILDNEGTVIRSAFQVSTSGGRIKVVSDGTLFFVFFDDGGQTITVVAFDQLGIPQPGTTTASTLYAAGENWDVCHQDDAIGVALVHRGSNDGTSGTGGTMVLIGYSGSSITVSPHDNASIQWGTVSDRDAGGAILTNRTGDGHLYIATFSSTSITANYSCLVQKLDTSANITHTYTPISSAARPLIGIVNVVGYVEANGTVHVMVSRLPYTGSAPISGFAQNALTEFGHATTSTDNLGYAVVRSLQLSSRVDFIGSVPVAWTYYASVPSYAALAAVQLGQPTYFLLRADTGAVVGRVLHQTASMDWTWTSWDGTTTPPPNSFQVSSPRVTGAGQITAALGQAGRQQVSVSGDIVKVNNFVSTVGITDVTLGQAGTCIDLDHETLIPGALVRSFDGVSFSASGIELGPEQPTSITDSSGGSLTGGQTYGYVIVYERMDRSGRKVRSASSINVEYTVPGSSSGRSATLQIPTLRATTHDDVIISVYRTVWANNQQGTTHRKITNDLAPLMNDRTVDFVTFVDDVSNDAAAVGEVLYGGTGAVLASEGGGDGQEVDHDPPPPSSAGCVFGDRAFVIGPDGSVSFSLPGSALQPFAFNEGLFEMTVPTHDKVVALAALDKRLIFLCESSIWFVESGSFLDATGAGDIPTPEQLPITHGCTGVAAVVPEGVVYASSAGGFYLLGRDLTSKYIGAAVEDEMVGTSVRSIASDENQRIYALTTSNKILVYDIVFGGWYIWEPPSMAQTLACWNGQLVYTDGADVFVLDPEQVADNPGGVDEPILTTIEFEPMSFGEVQMFWDLDLEVSGGTEYALTATLVYDLDTSEPDVFPTFDAQDMDVDGSGRARFNIPITQPECTWLSLTLTDSFPRGPSSGFVLEKMVAAVGVIPGKRRNNLNQRVKA